ncbi:hypothetical protein H70357_15800 [Paenibacillus sp. FSL H7-0357]|uniref:DUF4179 domain-containing protein n=1 Tax=Paenibacillus sp. FSL H7-0357 TaxID=1536774 RepID=UPI0004F6D956|nr:DUF4179 domain-containing protein [Paenibacillus sp. FSL H7-0357]AIQ17972.1 hypothetical protein H70357_15800 [Paenibacillus sp. FSL H7-0357]
MKKWAYTNHNDLSGTDNDLLTDSQLYTSSNLADDFTERVMEQVRNTEIQPASGQKLSEISGMQTGRTLKRGLKWGSSVAAVIGIASLLFFIGRSGTVSETLSTPPQKPFLLANQWAELGLLDAKILGVVQQPDIEKSDKGYTLVLQDVVADPTRLVLNITIMDENGLASEDAMSRFNASQLEIRNEAGESIGELKSVMSMDKNTYGNPDQASLLLTYVFPDEAPGSTVVIQGNIHELETNKVIAGDWSFSYEADMTAAQALTVTTDLKDHVYTTPDGMKLEMDQVMHTPAGVTLKFNTSLTGEAASLISANLTNFSHDFGVMFHFVDEKGEELSRINSYISGGIIDTSFGYTVRPTEQAGKLHWTYYFKSLPYDSRQVRFILDGYNSPVKSNDSVTFHPHELNEKPAVFSAQGDVLKVNKMEIKEIKDEPGISGWMSVSGEFTNRFANDKWVALDGQGKEYKVIFRGGYTMDEKVIFGETGNHANEAYLIAKGMTELPEELTLRRVITDKKFTDVNWSFDLPKIEVKKP